MKNITFLALPFFLQALYKDQKQALNLSYQSLFTRIKEAFDKKDLELASNLYIELEEKMEELRKLYSSYKRNLLDI